MRTTILNLLTLLVSFQLFAQKNKSNIRIGLLYAIDQNISQEHMPVDEYTGYSADYDQFNYKIGLTTEYAVNKGLTLNSGVIFSNKNFTGSYYCAVCDFAEPPAPEKIQLQFIEVPLSLRYYFFYSKLRVFADAGFINQLTLDPGFFEKEYLLSASIGGGVEYNIHQSLAIQFMTEYNKGLTDLYKESDFKIDIISFRFGLMKRFN